MRKTSRAALLALFALLCLPAAGQELAAPARQLAEKIAAATGPGDIALRVENRASFSATEVSAVRRALEEELQARGLRLAESERAAAEVDVWLSQNLQGALLIGRVQQGPGEPRFLMVGFQRVAGAAPAASTLSLKKTLLYAQPAPILDAQLLSGPERVLAVLTPSEVLLVRGSSAAPDRFSLNLPHALPRDFRGRLLPRSDRLFDIYLPGMVCGSSATAPLAVGCRASDDPWPLGNPGAGPQLSAFYGASRNFFSGVLSPGVGKLKTTAPFYTAAPLERPGYTLWAFRSLDGKLRLLDGVREQVLSPHAWGSDIALVKSACGSHLLVTAAGDQTAGDTIRAYEIADRQPVAVTPPLELPGPVTALWSSQFAVEGTAIVRNLNTGNYEAYSITTACGQ